MHLSALSRWDVPEVELRGSWKGETCINKPQRLTEANEVLTILLVLTYLRLIT